MIRSPLRLACLALALLAPVAAQRSRPQAPHPLHRRRRSRLCRCRLPQPGDRDTDDRPVAREGAELEQFYVQPMCTPTRAALMTGRYPMRYGLQSFVILPEQNYGIPLDENCCRRS